jgi:hypothetical protein
MIRSPLRFVERRCVNGTGTTLWLVANVLLSILAIVIVYYDDLLTSVLVWIVGFSILIVFRP